MKLTCDTDMAPNKTVGGHWESIYLKFESKVPYPVLDNFSDMFVSIQIIIDKILMNTNYSFRWQRAWHRGAKSQLLWAFIEDQHVNPSILPSLCYWQFIFVSSGMFKSSFHYLNI